MHEAAADGGGSAAPAGAPSSQCSLHAIHCGVQEVAFRAPVETGAQLLPWRRSKPRRSSQRQSMCAVQIGADSVLNHALASSARIFGWDLCSLVTGPRVSMWQVAPLPQSLSHCGVAWGGIRAAAMSKVAFVVVVVQVGGCHGGRDCCVVVMVVVVALVFCRAVLA